MERTEQNRNFYDDMEESILQADISENEKSKLMKNFLYLKEKKINLLITGATGCGKSSTINALFETEVAKVGVGADPETMNIQKYEMGNLILWDSPGLGDGKEADNRHAKNIINLLNKLDDQGELLIDLVLVILDGGSRDLGTSYELINNVIIPNLGKNKESRILVAINQCDVALKGRYWDYEKNCPEPKLEHFLEEKVESVHRRIKEATDVDVQPIYYCAGFKMGDLPQERPYNLSKLLYYIIKYTPKEKRFAYLENINQDQEMWRDNDELRDYGEGIRQHFIETVQECALKGQDVGENIGAFFGEKGRKLGGKIGKGIGTVYGIAKEIEKHLPKFPPVFGKI